MARFFDTFNVIEGDGPWTNGAYLIDTLSGGISLQTQNICSPPTAVSEVQTATMTGSPTGGSFTLTFKSQTTADIAYNATGSAVQSALQALSTVGSGNATVSGPAGGPWVITFAGSLRNRDQPSITANNGGLTGGTSPAVNLVTSTPGSNTLLPPDYPLAREVEPFACSAYGIVPVRCDPANYETFITSALAFSAEYQVSNALWYGYTGATGEMYLEHPDVEVIPRTGDMYTIVGRALEVAYQKTPFLQPVIHLGWQSAMSLQFGLSSLQLPFVVPQGYPPNAIAVTDNVTVRLGSIKTVTEYDTSLNRQYFTSTRLAAIEFDPGTAVRVADS